MATKKYPHEEYLEDGKDLFAIKDLPSELQTQIKVWNMHKNKRDEKENGIRSLNIANELEVWMKEKGFLDEEDEPQTPAASSPPAKTEAEIAAEVEAKLKSEAAQKAADEKAAADAAAAQKAADEKAAADAAAAQKAADEKAAADAAAQKAADEKAAADAAAAAEAEAKKKADPHYGQKYYPLIGWIKE